MVRSQVNLHVRVRGLDVVSSLLSSEMERLLCARERHGPHGEGPPPLTGPTAATFHAVAASPAQPRPLAAGNGAAANAARPESASNLTTSVTRICVPPQVQRSRLTRLQHGAPSREHSAEQVRLSFPLGQQLGALMRGWVNEVLRTDGEIMLWLSSYDSIINAHGITRLHGNCHNFIRCCCRDQ